MNKWQENFIEDDIFFVTPDVKRGLGLAGILPKYHIICTDFDPVIPVVRKQGANIFCLEELEGLDTSYVRNSGKLLEIPQVLDYIKSNAKNIPKIMYFKPSVKLDILIEKNHFLPIGNTSHLNELYEDKINFYRLSQQNFPEYCLPCVSDILGNLNYLSLSKELNLPFILQFGHGWAGNTTFFIKNEKEFNLLAEKFPHTRVKISKFVDGFTILNNCCISNGKVSISSPAIQIDGISQLSGKPGVTCGRQWPAKFISQDQIDDIKKISLIIGNLMNKGGFRGFFGIDFLIERVTGKIYLSEINSRLTASCAFFTLLEDGLGTIPLLAYHMGEFLGKVLPPRVESDNLVGSQIIFRKRYNFQKTEPKLFGVYSFENNKSIMVREDYRPQDLQENEYIFIGRPKTDVDADNEFARIETKREVLEEPKKLNSWISKIIDTNGSE